MQINALNKTVQTTAVPQLFRTAQTVYLQWVPSFSIINTIDELREALNNSKTSWGCGRLARTKLMFQKYYCPKNGNCSDLP